MRYGETTVLSRIERKSKIDIVCPSCGVSRLITVDTIRKWAENNQKDMSDYAKDMICRDCLLAKRHAVKRNIERNKLYEVKCCKCGKTRYVKPVTVNFWLITHQSKITEDYFNKSQCRSCATLSNTIGEIGRKQFQGYILVLLKPDDPYICMAQYKLVAGGYCLEHRIVMARHLGRPLETWECVHHKDGNKQNNIIDNLQLVIRQSHITCGMENEKEKHYIKTILELRKELDEIKNKITT
jgi:hypothetical protein